jgi:hypothetical protein
LAATFLVGLSALGFTAKSFLGFLQGNVEYGHMLDRHGRVLLIRYQDGRIQSVTDLEGQVPPELEGKWLDDHALKEIQDPWRVAGDLGGPRTRSYRSAARFLIEFGNDTKPGSEDWWYVPEQGRLLGYNEESKHFVGSFGPEGFCPPNEQPRTRFEGELVATFSIFYSAWAGDYLSFADRVCTVDFRKRTVQTILVAPAGEKVLWAARLRSDRPELKLASVVTDKRVRVLDLHQGGADVFAAPFEFDRDRYQLRLVQRLEGGQRYRARYDPWWYLELETLETLPPYIVEYDAAGRELARHALPADPRVTGLFYPTLPLAEPSYRQALFGVVTSPAEAVVLTRATRYLLADFRASQGTEMCLLLQFLTLTTSYFIPGPGWNMHVDGGLVFGFWALTLLSAVACALACLVLARRYWFSRARCIGWTVCGFLFGPTGLLLMLALQEWPARLPCASCRQARLVDRDRCEHCGAAHAAPAADGTEIFDEPLAHAAQPSSPNGATVKSQGLQPLAAEAMPR